MATTTLDNIRARRGLPFSRLKIPFLGLAHKLLHGVLSINGADGAPLVLGCTILGEDVLADARISNREPFATHCIKPFDVAFSEVWSDMRYGAPWAAFDKTGYIGKLFGKPVYSDIVLPMQDRFLPHDFFCMLPEGHPLFGGLGEP